MIYSGSFYIQDYFKEKHFKAKLLENCNNELVNVTDESKIPEDCYYRMKWRKYKNHTTLTQNRNSLQEKGEFCLANSSNKIYKYTIIFQVFSIIVF